MKEGTSLSCSYGRRIIEKKREHQALVYVMARRYPPWNREETVYVLRSDNQTREEIVEALREHKSRKKEEIENARRSPEQLYGVSHVLTIKTDARICAVGIVLVKHMKACPKYE